MESKYGCQHLSNDELLRGFEGCQLAPGSFHHGDHVRLAWICVRRFGPVGAEERLLAGIQKMAEGAGVPQKFLYTTTVAWVRLVAARQEPGPGSEKFQDWIAKWPELLNKDFLNEHYSPGKLESVQARTGWLEPDRKPLD
jgi:hypothetical protein